MLRPWSLTSRTRNLIAAGMLVALVAAGSALAAETEDTAALAKAAQNPIAAMISLPFQNNTFFGVGPTRRRTSSIFNLCIRQASATGTSSRAPLFR